MEHANEQRTRLIPMPYQRRFYFSWLFGGEECYTEDEMRLRQSVRELRLSAGLPEEIRDSTLGWFREDKQALVNIYEDSWFFAACYKPHEGLKSDNFASNLLRHDVVSWSELGKFMLKLGDYLILRNQYLPTSHYNQPINYVLMDLRRSLERLASIKDEQRLLAGLKPLRAYIAGIERLISPIKGGDHVFLTDLRTGLYQQEKTIVERVAQHSIHRELEKIKHAIQNLAQESHAMLHFSFARKKVNAHPHIELLQQPMVKPEDLPLHPVSGAAQCLQDKASLESCPFLQLDSIDKPAVTEAYRRSIEGLQSLLAFNRLLEKALAMTFETGEVYSLFEMHQTCEPLLRAISEIAQNQVKDAQMVMDENQEQYRLAVQNMQTSSRLSRWFGSAASKAEIILANQDSLASFKIDVDALASSNDALQMALQRLHQHFMELNQERASELVRHARATIGDFFKSAEHWQEKYGAFSGIRSIATKRPLRLSQKALKPMGLDRPSYSLLPSTALPIQGCANAGVSRPLSVGNLSYSYMLAVPLGVMALVLFLLLVHRVYRHYAKQGKTEPHERRVYETSL